MSLVTCNEFLRELGDYLDETMDSDLRHKLETHLRECPDCFVILDSTQKTIRVFKEMPPQEVPEHIHAALMKAVESKMAGRNRSPGD